MTTPLPRLGENATTVNEQCSPPVESRCNMQIYSDPRRATNPTALPDCEVFYVSARDSLERTEAIAIAAFGDDDDTLIELSVGWYWWSCFPGCMPDSDPDGPFDTEQAAIAAAQNVDY